MAFTPDNWDDPQTVTITVAEDEEAADNTATVTHSVSGGDYGTVNVDGVIVTVSEPEPTPLPTFDEDTTDAFIEAIDSDEGTTFNQLLNDHGFPHYLEGAKSALYYAVEYDFPNAFDALLGHAEADPNVANGDGRTPLFRAVSYGPKEYVKKLLDHSDTDPNAYAGAIHASVLSSPHDNLEMLLGHPDINPNQQSLYSGRTALHMAARYQSADSVKLLLAHPDIDPSIENNDGYTPLELACFIGRRDEVVELLEEFEAE